MGSNGGGGGEQVKILGDRVVLIDWFQFYLSYFTYPSGWGILWEENPLGDKNPLINTMRVKGNTKNVEVPTSFKTSNKYPYNHN